MSLFFKKSFKIFIRLRTFFRKNVIVSQLRVSPIVKTGDTQKRKTEISDSRDYKNSPDNTAI